MGDVERIGIVGATSRATRVAFWGLLGGYRVILEDISAERLAETSAEILAVLDAAVARGEMDVTRRRDAVSNFSTTPSIDEVSRGADLLIDASPEDAELQLEIFTIFDKFARPQAILVGTADSIAIADLAEMTSCPERCIGLQFSDPASEQRWLRIVRAPNTSERTVRICVNIALRMGLEARVAGEPLSSTASRQELRRQ